MKALIPYLPALACGVMMLVMCVPMMRGHGQDDGGESAKKELADLRSEIERLRGEASSEEHSKVVGG